MPLEHAGDLADVDLGLVVAGLEVAELVGALFEEAEHALVVLLDAEALELGDMDTVGMFSPVTKYAVEVSSSDAIAEVVSNAFRAAEQGRPGSAFVSLPQDIVDQPATGAILPAGTSALMGPAPDAAINDVARLIEKAKNPVILLGLMASQPANSTALHQLLEKSRIPVTSTYQAAGAVNQQHFTRFAGRVGLFNNQAGDRLLHLADLIICIGYSPVEYEPAMPPICLMPTHWVMTATGRGFPARSL